MANVSSLIYNSEKSRILVADDVPENIEVIEDILNKAEYIIYKAANGKEALEKTRRLKPDIILLDAMMPYMTGFEVAEKIKNDNDLRLIPIIMITALDGHQDRLRGLQSGVDDFIGKPFNVIELQARITNLLKLRAYVNELENAEQVIFSLARAVEAKDKYTEGHCGRLSFLAEELGRELKLPEADLLILQRGGFLHDIGKIAISDTILQKPSKLSDEEFAIIKTHPEEGERICSPLKTLKSVLPVIRYHHERYNGSGYPEGLRGQEIPIHARIVGVVDCYDSLITARPYRKALTHKKALDIMRGETEGGLWDPEIMNTFIKMIERNGFKT